MARAWPRAACPGIKSSTQQMPWALRSISVSTSSDAANSGAGAQGRPEQGPPATYHLAVYLSGLDPSVTLTDLLVGIAKTAPVGMVLSAQLNHHTPLSASPQEDQLEAQPTGARLDRHMKANILFGNEDAPSKLLDLARRKKFRVQGRTPHVTINTDVSFGAPRTHVRQSRVLQLRGPPGAKGFDEETVRGVLKSSKAVRKRRMSTDSEPVETLDDPWEETRVMVWRFFDSKQARAFKGVLRRHFKNKLEIRNVADPCWDYQAMWRYIHRAYERPKKPPYKPNYPAVWGGDDEPWEDDTSDPLARMFPPGSTETAAQTEETTPTEKRADFVSNTDSWGH